MSLNSSRLEIIKNAFFSIAEEMGAVLIRAAYSTNIKDRRDCSCAIYTKHGELAAQAEHIPLHLPGPGRPGVGPGDVRARGGDAAQPTGEAKRAGPASRGGISPTAFCGDGHRRKCSSSSGRRSNRNDMCPGSHRPGTHGSRRKPFPHFGEYAVAGGHWERFGNVARHRHRSGPLPPAGSSPRRVILNGLAAGSRLLRKDW